MLPDFARCQTKHTFTGQGFDNESSSAYEADLEQVVQKVGVLLDGALPL